MKILYLFNRVKKDEIWRVKKGEDHDDHFFGMLRLSTYGVEADYLEMEQYLPQFLATFLRKYILNIHFAHLPLFPLFFKYDMVFTSTAFGSFFLKTILGIKKPKWILFDYNLTGLIGKQRTLREKILYYLVSHADGIVTISEGEERALRTLFHDKKIAFIHLGTDVDFFKPKEVEEENFILSVGRDPGRDFKILFESVKDLDIEVKITARPHQLKQWGAIPSNVTVRDFSPREIALQYARAKLVVLPLGIRGGQENDTMGCSTLVEAMAMGKPIVATRTSAMESYIEEGINGVLVPGGDSKALRTAIKKLLRNKDERIKLGERARAYAVEHCSADMFASALADFFKHIKK